MSELNLCTDIKPRGPNDQVSSKAVVKYSAFEIPGHFTQLQCNTDLNVPPTDWLNSSISSHLQRLIYRSVGFASFRMAHKFQDCLGDVDVVSDAKNIKNLLKLPYSPKNAISMMVHRIGNTLLIDEFDLQKYLLRRADDDWKWLRTFIIEHILSSLNENDRSFYCIKEKSPGTREKKNLLSKFLYYSLSQGDTEIVNTEPANITNQQSLPLPGTLLPEPGADEQGPDPNTNHIFSRNVMWTFENIQMLIGTDMPIFGGGTRPCISLRLRDMAKPISVLTGIDYWLDNLMCNVPEVVMCYHLDGIVQKYEIVKTEDLPYLEDSQFSPQVVRNVAQNILAFLKSNATKSGHTYWLFKGKNDDVVKLYDLTTLCESEECKEKSENPFTVPVAILLYTVARNMRNSSETLGPKKAGSIKMLLQNCIKLLQKEKHPQIVTSSHYILSDLHLPAYIDPKSPDFDCADDADDDIDLDNENDNLTSEYNFNADFSMEKNNVAVKNISETFKDFNLGDSLKSSEFPDPLIASVEERCNIALHHIYEGFKCLQLLESNENKITEKEEDRKKESRKQQIVYEELNPNMANPVQPIPLPYESLKNTAKVNTETKCDKRKSTDSPKEIEKQSEQFEKIVAESLLSMQKSFFHENKKIGSSWIVHLKLLLIEKLCLTYATLSEHYYNLEKYGKCLKCIYMALRSQAIVTDYVPSSFIHKNFLLGRAGDVFFQLTKNWTHISKHIDDFNLGDKMEQLIFSEAENVLQKDKNEYITPMENLEGLFLQSIKFYEQALSCLIANDSRKEILRRVGCVKNELGLKYMHWGKTEYDKLIEVANSCNQNSNVEENLHETLTFKSYDCFIRAMAAFEEVGDSRNLTFVNCNLGRFMRYRAHIYMKGEKPNDLHNVKKFYNEAFAYYKKALASLGSRKFHADIWDAVEWEYATATFSLAQLVQDHNNADPNPSEELERETSFLLQESLKFCKRDRSKLHEIPYKYRSGLIHLRLGSFHHSLYRRAVESNAKKRLLQLATLHYERAADVFRNLNEVTDYLNTRTQNVNLLELVAKGQTGVNRYRTLHKALMLIVIAMENIASNVEKSNMPHENITEIRLIEERLQSVLLGLTQLSSPNCNTTPALTKSYKFYKSLYGETLKKKAFPEKEFISYFSNLLVQITSMEDMLDLNNMMRT